MAPGARTPTTLYCSPLRRSLLTEDVLVAAETVLPEAIGEDGFVLFADLSFFGKKIATEQERLTEDVEKLWSAGGSPGFARVGCLRSG